MATAQAPRRMDSEQRRAQLTLAALAVIAERGVRGLSLEGVAERAGVTRNLLYHYFPRGRRDLELAAVEEAARQLTSAFVTDPDVPLQEKVQLNLGGFLAHAWEQTDAWRGMIETRSRFDEEIRATVDEYRDAIVRAIALNNFGTAEPGRLAYTALCGFLEYAAEVLDQGRESGLEPEQVLGLLAGMLTATVDAVRDSVPHTAR